MKKIYFLIRVQGLSRRCRREPHPLYIVGMQRSGYNVLGITAGPHKGKALLWGKFEAELLANSIRNWKGRAPSTVIVEAAK